MATGQGLVCRLKNLSKIENADNILKAEMFGETVIVSKDYTAGQLGILYDCETSLSFEYAKNNNLFRHSNLNLDTSKIGYLEDNCRIRPVRLRGCKCSALFMPIESLLYTGKKLPTEGMQINEWNGKEICKKYVRPIKNNGGLNNKPIKQVQKVLNFAEHFDTSHLLKEIYRLEPNREIIVTEKIHGTSVRIGLLPCINTKWYIKCFKKLGIKLQNQYKMVVGSRHCLKHIKNDTIQQKDSFYDFDIWTKSAYEYLDGKLLPGETVFAELCGFLPSGESIMPSQSNEKLKNLLDKEEYKNLLAKFGNNTIFSYGCENKQYKIFIYRITLTTEHGISTDLSWLQLKNRCSQLGVAHVPEIDHFWTNPNDNFYLQDQYWLDLAEADSTNFPMHIKEGITVRIEGPKLQPDILKLKSYKFKCIEGIIKDTQQVADLEESN